MRFTDRVYKALVLANSCVLLAIVLATALLALWKRDAIEWRLRSMVDRELVSSELFDSLVLRRDGAKIDHPRYDLKIHPTRLRRIQSQIDQLLEVGVMTDDLKIWHPARFYHQGQEYKVKVRLKGDLANHWEGDKKSWRLRFERDKLFQGRRVMDLTIPWDKGDEVEQVALDAGRKLGLLVPDGGFCQVRINGVDFGTYHWVERYSAEMLEKQGYPIGEIFSDRNLWLEEPVSGIGLPFSSLTDYASAYKNTVRKDSSVGHDARRWDQLMALNRHADDATFLREIPHLVNIEKFLTWNALTCLFGSEHGRYTTNVSWYYDNTSGLFEPILYDVSWSRIRRSNAIGWPTWKLREMDAHPLNPLKRLIEVPRYRQKRNQILWRLLHDERFDLAERCKEYFEKLRPRLLTGAGAWGSSEIDVRHRDATRALAANRKDLRDFFLRLPVR